VSRADAPSDWYARAALIDHFFGEGITPELFASSRFPEQGDFASEAWNVSVDSVFDEPA
jgi:hypothetical protein